MAGWLEDILINKSIHHIFIVMAKFRFHSDYVNYPFSCIFWAVLHNLQSRWILGNDVITTFYRNEIS